MFYFKYISVISLIIVLSLFIGCSSPAELKWNQEEGYKWAELSPDYFGSTGFTKLDPSSTLIQFRNFASKKSIEENRNYLNGSGVAAADVDGDGRVDLYFAQLEGPNKLFKNMGDFRFKDVTEDAGVAHEGYNSTGVVFADADGDADPDLLITSLKKRNELYINDGQGHFHLKKDSGLRAAKGSNTMALADIDSDGDLDLYITNYKLKTARDIFSAEELSTENTVKKQGDSLVVIPPFDQYYGIIKTDGRVYRNEYGEKDELYLNEGNGTFKKVVNKEFFLDHKGRGKGLSRDWGLSAKFHDLNGDMLPDLYVANDFWTPDRIWINQGDGIFKSIAPNAIRSMSFASMGVDFSDINRDGAVDIFATEMLSKNHQRRARQYSDYLEAIDGRPQYNRNSLYLNRRDNTFAEISYFADIEATGWSWATNFLDVNLDGYEDLIVGTGFAFDYLDIDTQLEMADQTKQNMKGKGDIIEYPRLELANKIFRNNKDLTFSDKSSSWGFTEEDISLGMAIADLDNDGDADIVFNRLNQKATVYQNTTNKARIAVKLNGASPNTHGIGAKVELKGASVTQQKEMAAGGSYVSGSQHRVFFAADEDNPSHTLIVKWRDGSISKIDSVHANRIYVVDQSSAVKEAKNVKQAEDKEAEVLFREISDRINHFHHEDDYTDRNVQPLLPIKISQQGPGISWIDYNRDGDDDLFISSGKGGKLAVFENIGDAQFEPVNLDKLNQEARGDQTTILGWMEAGNTKLIVGSANFEQGNPKAPSAFYYSLNDDQENREERIPGILSTTGPLAASDYDGDQDIDLFIGGRFKPGEYPKDAASRLFKNENGNFVLDKTNSQKLSEIGLVTSAVFSDYDRDGDRDLIISRAWDSIVLLENEEGNFRNISSKVGLDAFKGWWNGVTTGDFNNDGLPDIVATNIGKNSIYQPKAEFPLKLYYGDFDVDGTLDIIDSYYNPELESYVPRRRLYEFDSMPSVLRSVQSHEEFASSSVDEIFRKNFTMVPSKEINTIEHMLFLNTGEGFEAHPLPNISQLSAAFYAGVADFDNDGNEDLFLSQNLFVFPPNIPRLDAGRGLLLRGDGTGRFQAIPAQESGIKIYGEQRGASVSDFNQDGRADLVVSQNEARTKLFLNRVSKRGYRISLVGPEKNKDAIGSGIRLIYEDGKKGPLREIQVGSGYWSQNSTTKVLGSSGKAIAIEVNWFNGSVDTVGISDNKREYLINF